MGLEDLTIRRLSGADTETTSIKPGKYSNFASGPLAPCLGWCVRSEMRLKLWVLLGSGKEVKSYR